MTLRPRSLMALIVGLRQQWNTVSELAETPEAEIAIDHIYRHAWEALEDMQGWPPEGEGPNLLKGQTVRVNVVKIGG